MELFTLGEGHYAEQDVKEAARAFTGWSLDRETWQFVFRPRAARRRHEDRARQQRPLRRRRRARPAARAARDRAVRDREAVARIRLARSRSGRSDAHRRPLPRIELRHQGGVARAAALRRVLRSAEPRRARQVADRARRRHAARVGPAAGSQLPFALAAAGHGAKPDVAAQCQRLARRRDLDQHDHAARAQALRRSRDAR